MSLFKSLLIVALAKLIAWLRPTTGETGGSYQQRSKDKVIYNELDRQNKQIKILEYLATKEIFFSCIMTE